MVLMKYLLEDECREAGWLDGSYPCRASKCRAIGSRFPAVYYSSISTPLSIKCNSAGTMSIIAQSGMATELLHHSCAPPWHNTRRCCAWEEHT